MRRSLRLTIAALLLIAFAPAAVTSATSGTVRFATFNASLNRGAAGQALTDLSAPGNAQADAVAEIIQRARPDILLINEFDFYPDGQLAEAFQDNYLSVAHNGAAPIDYPYTFVAPSNTGVSSGFDLNNNGVIDTTPGDNAYGDDSLGFGVFEGQFGLAVFSKYPIDSTPSARSSTSSGRTCRARCCPTTPRRRPRPTGIRPAELAIFRLSSKSHWDVPIEIGGTTVHFLVSHPTPPVFDGPEDRNGTRNNDEIRFWADYITPGRTSAYIYDDDGGRGGLAPGRPLRDRRRPEQRPPRRRQHPGLDPAAARASARQHEGRRRAAPAGRTGATSRTPSTTATRATRRSTPPTSATRRHSRRAQAPATCVRTTSCPARASRSPEAQSSGRSRATRSCTSPAPASRSRAPTIASSGST